MIAVLWILLGVLIGVPFGALLGYVIADRRMRRQPFIPPLHLHLPEDQA